MTVSSFYRRLIEPANDDFSRANDSGFTARFINLYDGRSNRRSWWIVFDSVVNQIARIVVKRLIVRSYQEVIDSQNDGGCNFLFVEIVKSM